VRDAHENRREKMAAWNAGGEKHACFSPPGFHAAIFFLVILFRVMHEAKEGLLEGQLLTLAKFIVLQIWRLAPFSSVSRDCCSVDWFLFWLTVLSCVISAPGGSFGFSVFAVVSVWQMVYWVESPFLGSQGLELHACGICTSSLFSGSSLMLVIAIAS